MDVGLVCDTCSALTAIGVPHCARCGEPMTLDSTGARASGNSQGHSPPEAGVRRRIDSHRPPSSPPSSPAPTACSSCGEAVPAGFAFCPSCGAKQSGQSISKKLPQPADSGRSTLFFGGALQASRAKLTVIRGDGEDGVSFALAGTDHVAGRGDCAISFPEDPFLSPTHANFRYENGTLTVHDLDSLNGVFIRIAGTVEVPPNTIILIGEQVISVGPASLPDDAPDSEGTYFSASMARGATLQITQQLRGGASGWAFRVDTDVVSVGREANDINFPRDPFISGRHAKIQLSEGVLSVTDLGSRNGTFVRIAGEQVLKHGDYVFLGQQLLRVEIV